MSCLSISVPVRRGVQLMELQRKLRLSHIPSIISFHDPGSSPSVQLNLGGRVLTVTGEKGVLLKKSGKSCELRVVRPPLSQGLVLQIRA